MRGVIPAMLFAALPICASPAMGGTVQKISAQDGAVIVQFDGVWTGRMYLLSRYLTALPLTYLARRQVNLHLQGARFKT